MNLYEFTLVPNTQIQAKLDPKDWTISIVRAAGRDWVEALNSIDPNCEMYMYTSKNVA